MEALPAHTGYMSTDEQPPSKLDYKGMLQLGGTSFGQRTRGKANRTLTTFVHSPLPMPKVEPRVCLRVYRRVAA